MKQLFNYCPVMFYEEEMEKRQGGLPGYLEECHLQGVELFVYGTEAFPNNFELYKKHTVGVHLKFWPDWLTFWKGEEELLRESYPTDEDISRSFGGLTREAWLEYVKANIKTALLYEPEYLVWHVAHCSIKEIYTYEHVHNSHEVLEATLELYREVKTIIPDQVTVLFENLWWPGLNLTEPTEAEYFFHALKGEKVGIMLDTGHLLNTNVAIRTEQEGVEYLCRSVEALGNIKSYIKGLHLSRSLSGEYHGKVLPVEERRLDMRSVGKHISQLDHHHCFEAASLKPFIDLVKPEYVVHELFFDDFDSLKTFVASQQRLMAGDVSKL